MKPNRCGLLAAATIALVFSAASCSLNQAGGAGDEGRDRGGANVAIKPSVEGFKRLTAMQFRPFETNGEASIGYLMAAGDYLMEATCEGDGPVLLSWKTSEGSDQEEMSLECGGGTAQVGSEFTTTSYSRYLLMTVDPPTSSRELTMALFEKHS